MKAEEIKKLYDKLSLILKIAILADAEYPTMNLHQNEIKLLLKSLEVYNNYNESNKI